MNPVELNMVEQPRFGSLKAANNWFHALCFRVCKVAPCCAKNNLSLSLQRHHLQSQHLCAGETTHPTTKQSQAKTLGGGSNYRWQLEYGAPRYKAHRP
jgi:hypothetical protein